jgi:hypothetical protein
MIHCVPPLIFARYFVSIQKGETFMDEYKSLYWKNIKISAAAHLTALLALICVNFAQGCLHRFNRLDASNTPIEFTVVVPPGSVEPSETDAPADAPQAVQPAPEPEPELAEASISDAPAPTAPPPPKKPKIEISKNIVKVKADPATAPASKPQSSKPLVAPEYKRPRFEGPALSEKEIRERMALGAQAGSANVSPDAMQMSLLKIKETLYAAWKRPSAEYNTGRPAVVKIRIGASGIILDCTLTSSSENATFDQSVSDAVATVGKFDGLTRDFINAYADGVTVKFELQ